MDWYLLIPQSPGKLCLQLTAHTTSLCLCCTKSNTALRTAGAKDKNSASFRTAFSFLLHLLCITQSFHLLSPCTPVSLSCRYSCSCTSTSCIPLPIPFSEAALDTALSEHQAGSTRWLLEHRALRELVLALWEEADTLSPQQMLKKMD